MINETINNYPLSKAIELEELRKENEELRDLVSKDAVIREIVSPFSYSKKILKEITLDDYDTELFDKYKEMSNRFFDLRERVELHNKKFLSRKIKI